MPSYPRNSATRDLRLGPWPPLRAYPGLPPGRTGSRGKRVKLHMIPGPWRSPVMPCAQHPGRNSAAPGSGLLRPRPTNRTSFEITRRMAHSAAEPQTPSMSLIRLSATRRWTTWIPSRIPLDHRLGPIAVTPPVSRVLAPQSGRRLRSRPPPPRLGVARRRERRILQNPDARLIARPPRSTLGRRSPPPPAASARARRCRPLFPPAPPSGTFPGRPAAATAARSSPSGSPAPRWPPPPRPSPDCRRSGNPATPLRR